MRTSALSMTSASTFWRREIAASGESIALYITREAHSPAAVIFSKLEDVVGVTDDGFRFIPEPVRAGEKTRVTEPVRADHIDTRRWNRHHVWVGRLERNAISRRRKGAEVLQPDGPSGSFLVQP